MSIIHQSNLLTLNRTTGIWPRPRRLALCLPFTIFLYPTRCLKSVGNPSSPAHSHLAECPSSSPLIIVHQIISHDVHVAFWCPIFILLSQLLSVEVHLQLSGHNPSGYYKPLRSLVFYVSDISSDRPCQGSQTWDLPPAYCSMALAGAWARAPCRPAWQTAWRWSIWSFGETAWAQCSSLATAVDAKVSCSFWRVPVACLAVLEIHSGG